MCLCVAGLRMAMVERVTLPSLAVRVIDGGAILPGHSWTWEEERKNTDAEKMKLSNSAQT